MLALAEHLVRIALAEEGVAEIRNTNCGPRVNQYKAATTLPPDEPWPWCAAYICFCVREAIKAAGYKETATFRRPTTASAFNLINWSLAQDNTTQTLRPVRNPSQLMAGDIVIFKFSHCGIVTRNPRADGKIATIEGNTDSGGSREGGRVWRKTRSVDQIKARIRFMI